MLLKLYRPVPLRPAQAGKAFCTWGPVELLPSFVVTGNDNVLLLRLLLKAEEGVGAFMRGGMLLDSRYHAVSELTREGTLSTSCPLSELTIGAG